MTLLFVLVFERKVIPETCRTTKLDIYAFFFINETDFV